MNTSWELRKGVAVANNSGGDLTNEDVLIVIDTATLITASKMQSDCDDLRFTDSDGATAIDYWIESGCNTSTTRVWVNIPSLLSAGETIYFYYGNDTAVNAETRWPISLSPGTGSDGACTVSSDLNINTGSCVSRSDGDTVNFSVTSNVSAGSGSITLSSTPTGLATGDEILIINLQGTSTNYSNVGKYELASISEISTNTLSLDTNLVNGYDGTTQKIMVQRVPNYTNVTVNSGYTLTASAWDGTKGGVLLFKANGTLTVTGSISVDELGFTDGNTYKGHVVNGGGGGGGGGADGDIITLPGTGGSGGTAYGGGTAGSNGLTGQTGSAPSGGSGGNGGGTGAGSGGDGNTASLFKDPWPMLIPGGGGGGGGGANYGGAGGGGGGGGGVLRLLFLVLVVLEEVVVDIMVLLVVVVATRLMIKVVVVVGGVGMEVEEMVEMVESRPLFSL